MKLHFVVLAVGLVCCSEPQRSAVRPRSSALLSTTASWIAEADQSDAQFGASVAAAGDVDGDGFADVIVGSPAFDATLVDEGRVFLFRGAAGGLEQVASWTADSGHEAIDVGPVNFGAAVAGAGDVDADGYDDVLVGANHMPSMLDGAGRALLYRGSAEGLEAAPSWSVDGTGEWSELGWAVAGAGDVNGDGYADVIISARNHTNGQEQSYEGHVDVYLGSASGLETEPAWGVEPNVNGAHYGQAVAGAGDVDADGYDDIAVIEEADGMGVYLYAGSPDGLSVLPAWSASHEGPGWSVSSAGDVNADGYDDLVVGTGGSTVVYLGSATGLGDEPAAELVIDPREYTFGAAVSGAGDVNGDGFDDVVVGEFAHSNGEAVEGRALVYLGSSDGIATTPAWVVESNVDGAQFGWSLSRAGDVDDDGFDDVVIGAPSFTNDDLHEGRAFLFRGAIDDGAPCDGGLWRSGVCDTTKCFVDSAWYADGAPDPTEECRLCAVATDRTSWTSLAEGTECEQGLCHDGTCTSARCYIDGAWYVDGATSPQDECLVCDATQSPLEWSNAGTCADAGPGPIDEDDSGCSCAFAGSGADESSPHVFALALILLSRRRRRRMSARTPLAPQGRGAGVRGSER